jgi:hypothetical protein
MKGILATGLILSLALTTHVYAQGLPATDIWLVGVENDPSGKPVRISDGDGYNNQPHFSDDGSVIWYTREMPGEDGSQTDVAAYELTTSTTTMLTDTAESEYSPTPVPNQNAVSVIQADLQQKQYLWAVDVTNGDMDLLFPDMEPVGYHAWFSEDDVAVFILGDSFTLQTARLGHEQAEVIADNIGRSIRTHPKSGEVLFVDKNQEPWVIAAFSPETGVTGRVIPLFPGSEDFTVDNAGDYWTGNGSKLYKRSPGDARWGLVADFTAYGISNISRLAVHLQSGMIALVSDTTD